MQLALKVAGAKTILMSLWKVNDVGTQELMTAFYEAWLSGGDKLDAFRIAQRQTIIYGQVVKK
ncbi:MAG: CHAT domain-containing protein [Calditrichaeota bacterium]|nr:MAG: CHAT domain-containing protein [Calditrichota bacterium]